MPNRAATRSNRATATRPQLSAPTTTRTAATMSSCFMTSSLHLNLVQMHLLLSHNRHSAAKSCERQDKRRPECDWGEQWGRDAVEDLAGWAGGLRDRDADPYAAAEEEA